MAADKMFRQNSDLEEEGKGKCAWQALGILLGFFAAFGLGADWSFARKLPPSTALQVTLIPSMPSVPKTVKPKLSKPKPAKKVEKKPPPKPIKKVEPPKPIVKKSAENPVDIALKKSEEKEKKKKDKKAQREKDKQVALAQAKKEKDEQRAKLLKKAADQKELQKKKKQKEDRKKLKKEKKKAEAERKKDEDEKAQQEKDKENLQAKIAKNSAELAAERAVRAEYLETLKSGYMNRIIGRIESFLITPLAAEKVPDISVVIEVYLDESGGIQGSPRVAESSGIKEYDQAAVRAVLQAAPLPYPKDQELIKEFHFLRLHITP